MNGQNTQDGPYKAPQKKGATDKNTEQDVTEAFSDGTFTVKVTQDMGLRNQLRAGLVEAIGKNQTEIPLFVSWPSWLDDGIVCLYARDLHRIIHDAVKKTAHEIAETLGIEELSSDTEFDTMLEALPAEDELHPVESELTTAEQESVQPEPVEVTKTAAPSETEHEAPYSEAPMVDTAEPVRERPKPVTDQDIADKLFAELKKGKKNG